MSYPTTIDTPGTTMVGTTLLTGDDHSLEHREVGTAIITIESLLGTTAANNGLFNSYTAGQTPLPINSGTLGSIVSKGTFNNGILGSPTITGGTINNATLGTPNVLNGTMGTPTLVVGSDAKGDLYYRSAAGTLTNLAIGGTGQVLTVGTAGTLPIWQTAQTTASIMFQLNPTDGSTNSQTYVSIPGGTQSVAITSGSANIYGNAHAQIFNNTASNDSFLRLTVGGTLLGQQGYTTGTFNASHVTAGGGTNLPVGTYSIVAQAQTGNAGGTASWVNLGITILQLTA